MKDLPEKYYLSHFQEFLSFIKGPCHHLLDEDDLRFIATFEALEEDGQCVLVRAANRKSCFIKCDSLYYQELNDVSEHISTLLETGFFRKVEEKDLCEFLPNLTKAELVILLKDALVPFKSSAKKDALAALSVESVSFETIEYSQLFDLYLVRNIDQQLDYFLFLFFGRLSGKLNMFSMRDMGIMRTRRGEQSSSARFDTIAEAKTSYFYRTKSYLAKSLDDEAAQQEYQLLSDYPSASGTIAEEARSKYLFRLGQKLLPTSAQQALSVWETSSHHEAQERWVREQYKLGNHQLVQDRLADIIQDPESEHLLVFAEDFLARKFNKKRTSVLTDMLREGSKSLSIDEIYRDSVELGVKHYYQQQGQIAYRTENRLWQSLFALTFWQELHDPGNAGLVTEFDIKPQVLIHNDFYQRFSLQIEARLAIYQHSEDIVKHVGKMATQHYGKSNGLFRWHPKLLEVLNTLLHAAKPSAIQALLRAMAKDYKGLSDGFPDLMVVQNEQVRFEEIKAPSDQLRKNQLMTIRQMRQAGFEVSVTQVEWFIDPSQPYVVVDVETTGGKADQHRITEIGMVKMVEGKVIDTWQSLINPQRHISRFITNLTGIDNEMVADSPLFAEVAEQVNAFLEGAVFVAHNVNFDYSFFKKEFERAGYRFRMPKLCTVREMKKAVPGLPSYSLANLTAHFDIDMEQHHRALSDARAAGELLNIINEHRSKQDLKS